MTEDRKAEIYAAALAKWGKVNQIVILMEECAELQKECSKFIRVCGRKEDISRLAEEMADVEIMIEQVKALFNLPYLVNTYKKYKIERIETLLKTE